MKLSDLSPANGAVKNGKRKGKGPGSGNGKTAGKGHKGQKARSGGGVRPGFEGGQMPIHRRLPKRGFVNIFREEIAIVNLRDLNRFDGGVTVDNELLAEVGLVPRPTSIVKVLGNGEIGNSLIIKVNRISKSAQSKIEAAGGKVEVR